MTQLDTIVYDISAYVMVSSLTGSSTASNSRSQHLLCDVANYLIGNAGTGETTDKNVKAFRQWSIVPQRLIKVDGLPDLSTKALGKELEYDRMQDGRIGEIGETGSGGSITKVEWDAVAYAVNHISQCPLAVDAAHIQVSHRLICTVNMLWRLDGNE